MAVIIDSLYKITRLLDSGGCGVVYLGHHLRLNKNVVLKADRRILTEQTQRLYQREVEMLKNLSHTYIPQVYDYVSEGDIVYTVMDYIEGESLNKPLKRGERFSSEQVVKWAMQLLEALVYLHDRPPHGILHGDIKPSNIMLAPQGNICLIDFNIALALGEEGAVSIGRSHGYASPEHYGFDYSENNDSRRNSHDSRRAFAKTTTLADADTIIPSDAQTLLMSEAKDSRVHPTASASSDSAKKTIVLDARSDIFGLGATLYHLISGRKPAQQATDVIPLTSEDCAPGLAEIINKAMSPDKNARYQTAEDMLAAFAQIHRNDPRAKKFGWIRSTLAAALIALLIVGSFTTFAGLKRMESEKTMESYASASENALTRGDFSEAADLALLAMPAKTNLFTPPASAMAKKALTDALGVYDLSDGFKRHKILTLPSAPLMADLSPDGKIAAIVYAYKVVIVDLSKGDTLFSMPTMRSALAEARFLNNNTLIFAGANGLCAVDVLTGETLWTGLPATAIAVAADGGAAAAVYRDDDFAYVYNNDGTIRAKISFSGRKQRVLKNDILANPGNNLFALSASGRFLAVSFDDGSISVFKTSDASLQIEVPFDNSDNMRFEGGFSGDLLAFSSTSAQKSQVDVFDVMNQTYVKGLASKTKPYGVVTNENGIYVSYANYVVKLDPYSSEFKNMVSTDAEIACFAVSDHNTLAALNDGCEFFNAEGLPISTYKREYPQSITLLSDDFALLGGQNEAKITILKTESRRDAHVLTYDRDYFHVESRINADRSRIMLFSIYGFQLYDSDGKKLREVNTPDPMLLNDQQYSKESGNLALIYDDALRIYSGQDGSLLFEEINLRSVFYAQYGISILDQNGQLRLIDIDSGKTAFSEVLDADESFAAYCGTAVTGEILDGQKLIGASQTGNGYLFAVTDGTSCTIYDQNMGKRFTVSVEAEAEVFLQKNSAEAFFTETAVVISPMHGAPAAYSLKNGGKINDLEQDAYLTYITPLGEYVVSQYISIPGSGKYGMLMDGNFEPIALLPNLCDISDEQLVFDYPQGYLRQSPVYSVEKLLEKHNSL